MRYSNIVVLTGAGISAESGIKTFRDQNGLWENHAIEEVATPEGFAANPALVHQFYNARRAQLLDPALKPNAAHLALAQLEQQHCAAGGHFLLITQNVDNLHQRAGSKRLIAMHGQLQQVKCVQSGRSQHWTGPLSPSEPCSCCTPTQPLRPDIVWFGEMPYQMEQIEQALRQADLFMAIGTSGQVYPAAGFAALAAASGAYTVELNLAATRGEFAAGLYGPASKVVPQFITQLLNP
ncbi:Sir2 family NAD+-dependent deacetylase [Rheinheimera sp.]|uniref:Sir2 family NAD+-dependent deacetylase n=1 Tax=Rheinheimera sp. TaxID=1869214 RepID=UPI00307EA505